MIKGITVLAAAAIILSSPLSAFAGRAEQGEAPGKAKGEEESIEIVNDGTPQGLLNSAGLSPADADSSELDTYVDNLLTQILTEDMNTYDKVKACYDYLVDNVSYGSHMKYLGTALGDTTCRAIYNGYGEVEGFGAVALTANVGMCNAYASAFILMTRAIGLDSHLVEGSTGSARGGYTYHKWAEVDIDGATYVFDPQLEQDLRVSGMAEYSVFCKTYDQVPGRYIRAARND